MLDGCLGPTHYTRFIGHQSRSIVKLQHESLCDTITETGQNVGDDAIPKSPGTEKSCQAPTAMTGKACCQTKEYSHIIGGTFLGSRFTLF